MFLPLRVDVYQERYPIANYLLMATIVLLSVMGIVDPAFVRPLVMPNDVYPRTVTALTSVCFHSGFLHLVGNMLFLWIFGNAVNARFGHIRYTLLFLLAGWTGALMHYGLSDTAVIGASGAINGVMAAFLMYYPRNNVTVLFFLTITPKSFEISSGWVIAFWVGWDVLFLLFGTQRSISFAAHVGGFMTGLIIAMLCLMTHRVRPGPDEESLLSVLGIRKDD